MACADAAISLSLPHCLNVGAKAVAALMQQDSREISATFRVFAYQAALDLRNRPFSKLA